MPYLSRIRINPLRAASRTLLANPRALHGAVMAAIPSRPDTQRLLWRLDADDARRPHVLVLSRTRPDWSHLVEQAGWPDADGEHVLIRDYAPLLARLADGQEFGFRLTANPVQNTSRPEKMTTCQAEAVERAAERARAARAEGREPDRARSFRIGHRTAAAQLDWLLSRTERWGFTIPTSPGSEARSMDLGAAGTQPDAAGQNGAGGPAGAAREVRIIARERHQFGKGARRRTQVVLRTATFQGLLRVTDAELLADRLLHGVGPGKAYGCGLLTLAPLPAGTIRRPVTTRG
ncbi:CRISPR system Cascade subunit CasE [Actinoalloteichus hoggarensis]|nr:type I-E CRISPR-associated protein Cas6/Cse3/CasE [Actinoalloteichus hoggarensis]MBB5923238.1 CRISPR system Cascade subunit CasE [Actinoalloteichus hoggarensis]